MRAMNEALARAWRAGYEAAERDEADLDELGRPVNPYERAGEAIPPLPDPWRGQVSGRFIEIQEED